MKIRQINIEYCSKGGIVSDEAQTYVQTKVLPWMCVFQVKRGKCNVSTEDGEELEVCSEELFVMRSNRLHAIRMTNEGGGIECRWVYISARINKVDYLDGLYELPFAVNDGSRLGSIFDSLFCSDDLFKDYSCYHDILRVIFSLSKLRCEREENTVNRAIEYIENNYTSKITVSTLAAISNLSSSRFYAVFGERYGVSPVSYINYFRLAIASEMLLSLDIPINEISGDVGILDPIYFNKIFRKIYGVAPSNFRKLYKKV
jgi:AraC-like DNA-binding protein